MRLLATFILVAISLSVTGQTLPIIEKRGNKTLTYHPRTSIDTESVYADSAGKAIIIQNSLPKGGEEYTDSTGKKFAYVIFWTRVVNETDTALDLTINFPADSFPILPSPNSYLKVYLPPDTMTLDKVTLYNYGLTDLKSFLDTGFDKPTMLQRTINPKGECLFYVAVLFHQARGSVRTAFVLKERCLFYTVNLLDFALIPSGQITPKN